MALHVIPGIGRHTRTADCRCSPIHTSGPRPDGSHGEMLLHQPANYDDLEGVEDEQEEGRTDAAAVE